MLVLDISKMMRARGIRKPFSYLRDAGFPLGAVRKIIHGEYTRPSLEHIELLCVVLQCTPNDIMQWHPGEGQDPKLPLRALRDADTNLEFLAKLQELPVDQLRELGMKLRGGGA